MDNYQKDKEATCKITIVVNGRFHAFDYAAELYKTGNLYRLISSMPYSVAKKYGIGREVYIGMPIFEVLKRSWRILFKRELPVMGYAKMFTRTALRFIPKDSDCIISFAGYSREIFESKVHKHAIKVLDRGSTHTLSNIILNKQAADYHNVKWKSHSENFVMREIHEYNLADKILVPSSFVKQTFIENCISPDKIIQIPYAFSLKKFQGLHIESKEREPVVLFVGQISARKGIGVLINAMKLVRETVPEAKLWLAGAKNPLINNSLFDEKWISYFGVLRGQELLDKYANTSVFCLLSFEEGLALVLTEAKYFGLPIVATPNTGAEDIIDNGVNGFIVPLGDPLKTSEKIIELLINPNTLNSENKKNEDQPEMSWERFTEILLNQI
jgi:glycosyltransferase involved in cell wall biosynthesis